MCLNYIRTKKDRLIWLIILFLLLSALSFASCSTENGNAFLSITMTSYNNQMDTENGMTSDAYLYNLDTGKIKKEAGIDYTSQYPLVVYDAGDDNMYYSSYVAEDKGDQLFSYNNITGEIKQLTTNLFAINYIIPSEKSILLIAVERGKRILRAYLYQKDLSELIEVDFDPDFGVQIGAFQPYHDSFLIAGRMEAESIQAVDKYNLELGAVGSDIQNATYIPPNDILYEVSWRGEYEELYQTKNETIERGIMCDTKGCYFLASGSGPIAMGPLPPTLYFLEDGEKEVTTLNWIDDIPVRISQMVKQNENLYILGEAKVDSEVAKYPRAIYCYSLNTKDIKLIFKSDSPDMSYINNMTFVYIN